LDGLVLGGAEVGGGGQGEGVLVLGHRSSLERVCRTPLVLAMNRRGDKLGR
jgi:hypothetical protein